MSHRFDVSLAESLSDSGVSVPEMASRLGVSKKTVQRWRRETGRTPQPVSPYAGYPVSPDRLAAAERLLEDGAPVIEVVRTLGMHERTVRAHFPHRVRWSQSDAGRHSSVLRKLKF